MTCTDVAAPGEGYTCGACPSGLSGDGETCENIDECAQGLDDCVADSTCLDTNGDYYCECDDGYEEQGRLCGHRPMPQ